MVTLFGMSVENHLPQRAMQSGEELHLSIITQTKTKPQ